MNTPETYEVRRPDVLLTALSRQQPFDVPRVLLATVEGPYEDQQLTASTVLWDAPPEPERERKVLTEQALLRLGLRWTPAPFAELPLLVPVVVVRPGPVWWSWDETEVAMGLWYGKNRVAVREAAPITVTTRGWYCHDDELWGARPAARWAV